MVVTTDSAVRLEAVEKRIGLANQVALANVAGLAAILLSVIPVYIATRVTADTGAFGRT